MASFYPESGGRARGAIRARVVVVLAALAGCGGDPTAGPPESYVLLSTTGATSPAGLPVAKPVRGQDAELQAVAALLTDGFAAELLRTHYACKRVVARPDGPFAAEARVRAAHPTLLLLGGDSALPAGQGLAIDRALGAALERPDVVWLGLSPGLATDTALVQTLAGRLAAHLGRMVVSGGTYAAPPGPGAEALAQGYRMAMEVIAREWKSATLGPRGKLPVGAGTGGQRQLFADVRENRFVRTTEDGALRPADELLVHPGVIATVLYRMAQSKEVGHRIAPDAFYAPLVEGQVPPGVRPAAVLGPLRSFQAKLLVPWLQAAAAGRGPGDLAALVAHYTEAFPEERAEVLRLFVVTTFGATVKPGGVAPSGPDATAALAALGKLAEEVVAGRLSLTDAVPARAGR